MLDKQELQVQQKREVDKKTEGTAPGRTFLPVTDIFETPDALTVVLEMPGVDRNSASAIFRTGESVRDASIAAWNIFAAAGFFVNWYRLPSTYAKPARSDGSSDFSTPPQPRKLVVPFHAR